MYLELKGLFTAIGCIFLAIVMGIFFSIDFFIVFLIMIGFLFFIIGDLFLGVKMVTTHANRWLEPNKPGQEKCVLFDLAGNIDLERCWKKEEGKREFVKYKKEATIINRGKYPIRFPNGDRGFVGHESYDKDVDLSEADALDELPGDDIKEVYQKIMDTEVENNG